MDHEMCPEEARLRAVLLGPAGPEEDEGWTWAEAHVAGCPSCARILEEEYRRRWLN